MTNKPVFFFVSSSFSVDTCRSYLFKYPAFCYSFLDFDFRLSLALKFLITNSCALSTTVFHSPSLSLFQDNIHLN